MKKLLAILLSVLMLCSVIPFAAVAAAEEPTVQLSIVDELESVNAGEEFQVQVDLLNLADTAGLISALIQIDYDANAFELETYFDEDEEMWKPPIEVGAKYNVSSNKYITFGQIDEDTGEMKNCLVKYMRATATSTQVRREEHFFTVTFKVKDDAPSGTYDLTVIKNDGLFHGNVEFDFAIVNTSITVNGTEPSCKHEYDNACDVDCNLCGEAREVQHNVVAVEAKDATCTELGNIEYWYCDVCGMAWLNEACTQNTNLKAVVLPMVDHEYLYACDQYCMNCGEHTNPHAKHSKIHVEAKEAVNCVEYGNKEYWQCEYCNAAWLDADGRIQTNLMSVRIAGECISDAAHPCQDGVCINCGLPCYAEVDHEYTNAHDASCNVCGAIRELVLPAKDIILFGGNSVSETKNGLAFKFDAAVAGIAIGEKYAADYSNATVTIDGVEYKLMNMGAVVNNKGLTDQTLADVDGERIKGVEAEKVFGEYSFAVRVINIPEAHLDTAITARPYFIYENAEGGQITVYGEDCTATYSSVLG